MEDQIIQIVEQQLGQILQCDLFYLFIFIEKKKKEKKKERENFLTSCKNNIWEFQ